MASLPEPAQSAAPRVFVSYSHDSPAHEANVLALANRLRSEGIDAVIDQYEPFPPKGWLHWMRQQIEEANFVLAVCTETYRRRAEGKEAAGKGLGVTYEGSIIDQELYDASSENHKFVPIFLTHIDSDPRPTFLRKYQYFVIDSGYDDLYRLLTNQPKITKPPLGQIKDFPPVLSTIASLPGSGAHDPHHRPSLDARDPEPPRLPSLDAREALPDYRNAVWTIPPRNPYFSGREEYLEKLYQALHHNGGTAALTQAVSPAISGLGGIGKTQTAIEYAHRHRAEYGAGFFIVADSPSAVISGYANLARVLDLPEKDEKEIEKAARAAKHWLDTNTRWLLILDNVDEMADVKNWLPDVSQGHRHVIITTRIKATGLLAKAVELPKMTPTEGAKFLLDRAKIDKPSDADRTAAEEISKEVGGLPLALDQAGAYIEEASLSAAEYLKMYRSEGKKLRAFHDKTDDHASVHITFTLAFAKLSEPAKDILRMCAFLAPDAIPEEILTESEEPDTTFIDARTELIRYSLIERNSASKTIDIHRLLQDVVKDEMDPAAQHQQVERVVNTLAAVLPHRGQHPEAELLLRCALDTREELLGPEHPDTFDSIFSSKDEPGGRE